MKWLASLLSTLKIAYRNLGRNKKRTLLALVALSIAQFFVVAVDGFMAGYEKGLRDLMTGPLLGHAQVHAPNYRQERSMDETIAAASEKTQILRAQPEVASVFARVFAPCLAAKTEEGFTSIVLGVELASERHAGGLLDPANTHLLKGELPGPTDAPSAPSAADAEPSRQRAWLGSAIARRQKLNVGDELALIGQTADGSMAADLVLVAGVIQSDVQIVNDNGILIELAAAQEIFGLEDSVHELTLRGRDFKDADELVASVQKLPGFSELEVMPWNLLAPQLVQMLGMMNISTLIILVFLFSAAAAGIANTMIMSTFERTREMGVLLALGAAPARVVTILLFEALFLGVLGLAVGSLFGALCTFYWGQGGIDLALFAGGSHEAASEMSVSGINFGFRIFPELRPSVMQQTTLAMALVCLLAALWPAWYVARLSPTEAMRK